MRNPENPRAYTNPYAKAPDTSSDEQSLVQMQFDHRKALSEGDDHTAANLARIIARSDGGRIDSPVEGPNGENIAQMKFEMKKLSKQRGKEDQLEGLQVTLSLMEAAEEKKAWEEMSRSADIKRNSVDSSHKHRAQAGPTYGGDSIQDMTTAQLKFEVKKLGKQNDRLSAGVLLEESARRGQPIPEDKYFWT